MPIDWGTDGVFGSIGKAVKEANAESVGHDTINNSAIAFIRDYLTYNFRWLAGLTYQSFDDLWYLGLLPLMDATGESVQQNSVTAGAVAFTVGTATPVIKNAAGTPNVVSATQMLLQDDAFRIVCISAYAGSDLWAINSMRRGQISNQAQTGVLFGGETGTTDTCGLSFIIEAPSAGAYAIGDTFEVAICSVVDQGVFQTFFRDNFNRILPATNAPSISDALAGGPLPS